MTHTLANTLADRRPAEWDREIEAVREYVSENPGATRRDVELDLLLSKAQSSLRLRRLVESGAVLRGRDGKQFRYFPAGDSDG